MYINVIISNCNQCKRELFFFLFVVVLSLKSCVYFTLTTQLNSNWAHFKCWLVACRHWPLRRTAQPRVYAIPNSTAWEGGVMLTLWQSLDRKLQAPAQMLQWVLQTPFPSAYSLSPTQWDMLSTQRPSVCREAAPWLWNAPQHIDKRTSAVGKRVGFCTQTRSREAWDPGATLEDKWAASSHGAIHFSISPCFHQHKRWNRMILEISFGSQISLVVKIMCIRVRQAWDWVLTPFRSWWTWANPKSVVVLWGFHELMHENHFAQRNGEHAISRPNYWSYLFNDCLD